ncbi:MAG: hypothetical protein V9F04_01995 [Dermatophilaceae bacterium]
MVDRVSVGHRGLKREHGGAGLGQALAQRVTNAALVEHDDDARVLERDAGGHALGEVRPEHRDRDPTREGVDRGQAALEDVRRGGGCRSGRGCGWRRTVARGWSGWSGHTQLAADPPGDVLDRREVAQLHGVVAFDLVVLADGGEDFGLFDGVDAEVGFEVKVGVEQVGRVTGQTSHDVDDLLHDLVATGGGRFRRGRGLGRGGCRRAHGSSDGRRGAGLRHADLAADPPGDVLDGREVAQFHGVVAFDLVVIADRGEDFGLFDGVDAEVGFEVKVGVEQVGRVTGQTGHDLDDLLRHPITGSGRSH